MVRIVPARRIVHRALAQGVLAAALALAVPAASTVALAQEFPATTPLTPGNGRTVTDRQLIQRINAYFNGVRTMSGAFVQFSPSGVRTDGTFVLARPGKIRFDYDPPTKMQIVADGKSVAVRDTRRQTQDIWPLGQTPMRFLLANNIDLTRDAKVASVTEADGLITVVVQEKTVFGNGRLTLFFDATSAQLKQWTVTDAQGQDTSVAIYDVKTNVPVDPKQFVINYQRIL